MKKNILKSLLLVATVMILSSSACAHPVPNNQVIVEFPDALEHRDAFPADTVEVMSPAMDRTIKNVVVMPSVFFVIDDDTMRFPVLYLLHGAEGCYSDWSRKADLHLLADRYNVIIVCPDGQDSWYFDSPIDPKMQFETYVSKELVAYIDSHYPTYDNRYMRAITGLSMGGHGALFLAFRHPDVFWSCGSMSGNMDITQYADRWHIKDRLGEYQGNEQRWREHSVCNQVDKVKNSTLKPAQNIIIDNGLNDIFIKNNIALHDKLVEAGIDHDFTVRPGRHNWNYWVNSLDYHMMFFDKAFRRGKELMNKNQ